ncbi:MAG: TAXI family TRAP transporter solute-binding subunit [Myxococcota bacterium]
MSSLDPQRENEASADRGFADLFRIGTPLALLVVVGFFVAYRFVDPAPPDRIVMATGQAGGAYAVFGETYRARLAEFDIEVELRETAGTAENLERLREGEVDVAFVQGGVARAVDRARLESLGSLFYEPLWIFLGSGIEAERLTDLEGLRLGVGPEGSGTIEVATRLLERNGHTGPVESLPIGESVEGLLAGRLDAIFLIAGADSPVVGRLLRSEAVAPFSFRRAEAYTRTDRFLAHVTLPEGMIDYARNLPSQDVELIAPTANLAVREGLHPALVDLLVQAASSVHGRGGVFEAPGAFPTPVAIDLPLNPEAHRFYEYGPPFLQRYLPFWLATLIDRLKVMLIPLVALLIPVFRLFPPIYRWRVRSRIYRWYTELREIDPRNRGDFDLAAALAEADRIEREVAEVEAPASYAQELYDLHLHVEFVQRQLAARQAALDAARVPENA